MNIYRKDSALISNTDHFEINDQNTRNDRQYLQSDMGIEINEDGNTPTNIQLINKVNDVDAADGSPLFNLDNLFQIDNNTKGMNRAKSGGFLVNRNKNIENHVHQSQGLLDIQSIVEQGN